MVVETAGFAANEGGGFAPDVVGVADGAAAEGFAEPKTETGAPHLAQTVAVSAAAILHFLQYFMVISSSCQSRLRIYHGRWDDG
jgi:hypothetical protein